MDVDPRSAFERLLAEWPNGGWQPSYMGDDVLIGIVQGAPVTVWWIRDATKPTNGYWRAKMHYGGPDTHRDGPDPVAAVRAWIALATAMSVAAAREVRPKLTEDPK